MNIIQCMVEISIEGPIAATNQNTFQSHIMILWK